MATLVPVRKLVTVGTAGVPVPIFSSTDAVPYPIVSVIIQAKTQKIYIGDGTASAGILLDSATNDKQQLTADAQNVIDLAKIYLDTTTNGGTAEVYYFKRV